MQAIHLLEKNIYIHDPPIPRGRPSGPPLSRIQQVVAPTARRSGADRVGAGRVPTPAVPTLPARPTRPRPWRRPRAPTRMPLRPASCRRPRAAGRPLPPARWSGQWLVSAPATRTSPAPRGCPRARPRPAPPRRAPAPAAGRCLGQPGKRRQ